MRIAVTGGASGIGLETVKFLSQQGHELVVYDRQPMELEGVEFIPLDLTDNSAVDQAARQTSDELDGLCNIAGIPPLEDNSAQILRVNFIGTRRFTEALLPKLKQGAAVVNLASRAGSQWMPNLEEVRRLLAEDNGSDATALARQLNLQPARAYRLSKEAVIVWSMALARQELQRHRAVSVSPAAVETPILRDFVASFGDIVETNRKRVGREGQPEEIARVLAFLLTPENAWINGVDLPVDGGIGAANLIDELGL